MVPVTDLKLNKYDTLKNLEIPGETNELLQNYDSKNSDEDLVDILIDLDDDVSDDGPICNPQIAVITGALCICVGTVLSLVVPLINYVNEQFLIFQPPPPM